MARGGKREGAGRKSTWNNKETQLIRVPKVLSKQVLQYAHELDRKRIELVQISSRKSATRQMKLLTGVSDSVTESIDVEPMNLTDLSKRLGRHKSTLSEARKKGAEHLARWSREKDPNGLEWEYRAEEKLFYPVAF